MSKKNRSIKHLKKSFGFNNGKKAIEPTPYGKDLVKHLTSKLRGIPAKNWLEDIDDGDIIKNTIFNPTDDRLLEVKGLADKSKRGILIGTTEGIRDMGLNIRSKAFISIVIIDDSGIPRVVNFYENDTIGSLLGYIYDATQYKHLDDIFDGQDGIAHFN